MNQLDSCSYKRVAINNSHTLLMRVINNAASEFIFPFECDRNMAQRFPCCISSHIKVMSAFCPKNGHCSRTVGDLPRCAGFTLVSIIFLPRTNHLFGGEHETRFFFLTYRRSTHCGGGSMFI